MRVTEHLDRATSPLISFEIIPPLRGGNFRDLTQLIEDLVRFEPPFIDITSHAAEVSFETPRSLLTMRSLSARSAESDFVGESLYRQPHYITESLCVV